MNRCKERPSEPPFWWSREQWSEKDRVARLTLSDKEYGQWRERPEIAQIAAHYANGEAPQ